MKSAVRYGSCLLACGVIFLKLFTFEFYFADDPTCGVALRGRPGWDNRSRVSDSKLLRGRVLIEDENDFHGSGLYRILVGWAFIPLTLGAAFLGITLGSRARRAPDPSDGSGAAP